MVTQLNHEIVIFVIFQTFFKFQMVKDTAPPNRDQLKTLHKSSFTVALLSSRVHMTRFAYVCKFCIYAKFAYVRKSGHVYAFTHVCKICTYAKVEKFAPASDQVQISFCVYAKFAYMQIWSCEQKAKFAHVSIYLILLNNCRNNIVSRLELFCLLFNLTKNCASLLPITHQI